MSQSYAKSETLSRQMEPTLFDLHPERPLLMLMDGHALVHRAWHAIPTSLTVRLTGEEVRGVFGFANSFLKALTEWKPTHCAIAFDLPVPTFRHEQYKEYKAQRPATPPELKTQFNRVRQLMEAFRIPVFAVERFEADDVLGTLCRQAEEAGLDTIILTGDTDTLQLVTPKVRVALQYRIQERIVYDLRSVQERYGGLQPWQQPHLKALQGDPSDNILGVPGVGPKTAVKLIQQFGEIDALYRQLDMVEPPKLQTALNEHRSRVHQGLHLTTIVRDVPVSLDIEAAKFGNYVRDDILNFLREMEFTSLVNRIPQSDVPPSDRAAKVEHLITAIPKTEYLAITSEHDLRSMIASLREIGEFAFDIETTGTDPTDVNIVGFSFSCHPRKGWYVPIGHVDGAQLGHDQVISELRYILEDPNLGKIAHNANYDMTVLACHGIHVQGLTFDTMVAAALIGEKMLGLKSLAFTRLNEEMIPINSLIGKGQSQITMAEVPLEKATPYAAADADMTWRLYTIFKKEIEKEGLSKLMKDVEIPLVPVLVRMQMHGVALDTDLLDEMSQVLAKNLLHLEQNTHDSFGGRKFNINSPSQLSEILFKEMGLPGGKRTKSGGYSTDASVLESLKTQKYLAPEQRAIVEGILQYRELNKLKSTYVDALPNMINHRTRRLHTRYNQVGSATGRISSSEPNLQNIPVRTELGRRVRKAFVAQDAPRWTLLAADYSQVELRVLAHLSQDKALLEAFERDEDIHSATASTVYDVPLHEVTKDMRRIAKVMNFGIIYGLTAFGISQQTELSIEEGGKFIEAYFGKYPGIRRYLTETTEKARSLGYVETILGRKRRMPEMYAPNFQVRQAAERIAVNMPVQGTAADIVKVVMVQMDEQLSHRKLRTRMLMQVHDELIFEVPQEELRITKDLVTDIMSNALERKEIYFSVPLKVDIKVGYTWDDME
jgi:DNA polymerase-1